VAKTILVIDDDLDIQRLLAVTLRAAGYETVFAGDGVSAIAEARKHRPDLIVLDLGLPAGDGYTVLERLQRMPALAFVPVIAVTARDPSTNKERVLSAGAVDYVQKPFERDEIVAAVQRALPA
jgi:CheY-like chemotaxis protein